MAIRIPISKRARKYGYIIWPKSKDDEFRSLLSGEETVTIVFGNADLGKKEVDWKYRRISVGPTQTRQLSLEATSFQLISSAHGRIS